MVAAGGSGDSVTLSTTTGGVVATLVTGADAVSITATAGDITVGAITATGGTIGVTATAGSINDAADDNTADFTAGGLITLTAQDEIGVLGSGSDTDLEFAASSSVDVSTTRTGAIDLDGLGALTLTDVDTNDGTITVDGGGALTVTDVASGNNNAIALTTSSGDITGLATVNL